MKTCFFIGHREQCPEIREALKWSIVNLILQGGVKEFVVGGYGGFDALAHSVIMELKFAYPQIRCIRLLPYYPTGRRTELEEEYDGTFYPPGMETVPKRFAIVRANRYMVETADYLITYVWHTASNARNILEYAREREEKGLIRVENLGGRRKERSPEAALRGMR